MANSVDPDQMPHSVASDQGLHCLHSSVCPNIMVPIIFHFMLSVFYLLWYILFFYDFDFLILLLCINVCMIFMILNPYPAVANIVIC